MSNLKYNFINEDHKRMHNALIAAGWSCENDVAFVNISSPWHWFYQNGDQKIVFDNYQRTVYYRGKEKSFSEVADIIEAELKDKQPTFKVGDKVEILSDATYGDCTVVEAYGVKSAIGEIGSVIESINEDFNVIGLSEECYDDNTKYWTYKIDQLRKVEDVSDQPVQPNEMVDHPVETHDEIEDAGLTWKQGIKQYPRWKSEVYSKQFPQVTIEENHEEHYLITKDNIVEVLEYNKVDNNKYSINGECITCIEMVDNFDYGNCIYFKNPLWLKLVEVYFGKLQPIPKPKFDFVQYLLDNGFRENVNYKNNFIKGWVDIQITGGKFHTANKILRNYELTEENAKTLVEIAKQGEKLI